jgi:UDP-GlcNAc3NAcA epimerase
MKIITIIGARPQFIKAAALSNAIKQYNKENESQINEILVHTGQHFDSNMSQVFFDELSITEPVYNLSISGGTHGSMTGKMLIEIEKVLLAEQPDWVLIYGDTNSTLAGAIAASKLHIKVAHVEAGLRSFNMKMPEEVNRILSDKVSTLLFCPTQVAIDNLAKEGVVAGVSNVGDVMFDVTLHYQEIAKEKIDLSTFGVKDGKYILSTVHRAENTDSPERLTNIIKALAKISETTKVVLPLHPRTKAIISELGLSDLLGSINIIEPTSYLEMLRLEIGAQVILTDSGGVQKEAYFNLVPCVTMRDETEWVETIDLGVNELVGASYEKIISAVEVAKTKKIPELSTVYGDGEASQKIISALLAN